MQNLKYNKFIEDWNIFFKELEEYNSPKSLSLPLSDLISNGLKVFLKFPNAINASVFIFDHEQLEFDHRMTLPFNEFEIAKSDFDQLVDLGALSEALQTSKTFIHPQRNVIANQYFMIIPLVSLKGLNGLIIVKLASIPNEMDSYFIRICAMHGALIANYVENNKLNSNVNHLQALLDQKIALKTMSLNQSKRELQTILDAVQIGIIVIDLITAKIINVNYIACSLSRYQINEIEGNNISLLFPEENDDLFSNINEIDKISNIFESKLRTKHGIIIPIIRSSTNVNFAEKKVRIDSFIDITDRKNAENALKEANELLELKVLERTEDLQTVVNRMQTEIAERIKAQNELVSMYNKERDIHEMKTKFISMVSHEFRTPLTVIKTSSEILKNHNAKIDIGEQLNYLNRISFTVDKMTILLDDILQIGKYDESKQIHTVIINLPELCTEIVHDVLMTYGNGRIIKFSKSKDNHFIYADERLLRLILNNILSNALKYSEIKQEINFELICDKDFSTFLIADKGIGIPGKDMVKIYESFHRGSNVGTITGTGLGLSIVHKSVRDHGGNIEISSEVNLGTTVVIKIPFVTSKS